MKRLPTTAAQPDRLLTLAEIYDLAGVTDKTVTDWRKNFGLRVVRLGRRSVRVELRDWQAFLTKNKVTERKNEVGKNL